MHHVLLRYNSARIALSHERDKPTRIESYATHPLLTVIREGRMIISHAGETVSLDRGNVVLLGGRRMYSIQKIPESGSFSAIVFSFHPELVREALLFIKPPPTENRVDSVSPMLKITKNTHLRSFIETMLGADFEERTDRILDEDIAKLRTTEALIPLVRSNSEAIRLIQQDADLAEPHLLHFMEANFLRYKGLEDFARASGRSLGSFKREFSRVAGISPYRWVVSRRLQHARDLILYNRLKPSAIYLDCGFEDLSHFSRAFTKKFGISPSRILSRASAEREREASGTPA